MGPNAGSVGGGLFLVFFVPPLILISAGIGHVLAVGIRRMRREIRADMENEAHQGHGPDKP
jgi:hypothetical protein